MQLVLPLAKLPSELNLSSDMLIARQHSHTSVASCSTAEAVHEHVRNETDTIDSQVFADAKVKMLYIPMLHRGSQQLQASSTFNVPAALRVSRA